MRGGKMGKSTGSIVGGALGFIGGAAIDIVTAGAATPFINPISGMMVGAAIGTSIQGAEEAQKAADTQTAAVGSGPSDTGSAGSGGTQTTTVNGQTVNTQYALAEQRVQQETAQTEAFRSSGLQRIGGMQVQEAANESAIRAGAAARGFRAGAGTAAMEAKSQQERGAVAIGQAGRQLSSSVAEQQAAMNTGYQGFRSAAAMKNYGYEQQATQAWIGAVASSVNAGTQIMKNWYPSLAFGGVGGVGGGYGGY